MDLDIRSLPTSQTVAAPASSDPARVLVAIVNYRTGALTVDCLCSLASEAAGFPRLRAVVADNASGDDSLAVIADGLTRHGLDFAELLPLPHNGGFASGNNAIVARALGGDDPPEFVLLLNPDTTVFPGLIGALVSFLRAHPEAGIAGAHQEAPDGTPLCSSFRFPTPLSELSSGLRLGVASRLLDRWEVAPAIPREPAPCDWVSGGCMMVRREVFERIGLLDESYFLYFEETDFCLRAREAGFASWFVPAARIRHIGGQSTGVTGLQRRPARRPAYWFESRRRFFVKSYGKRSALAADALFMLGLGSFRVRRVIQQKPDPDPPRFLADFARHSVFARGFSQPLERMPSFAPVDAGAPDLSARLASIAALADWAVREDSAGRPIVYAVPRRALGADELARTLDLPGLTADCVVLLDRLPRDAEGELDDDALAAFPASRAALVEAAERALSAHPDVLHGAALVVSRAEPCPRLHLADLVPVAPVLDEPAPAREPARAADDAGRPLALSQGPRLDLPPDAPATLAEALLSAAERFPGPRILHLGGDGAEVAQSFAELRDEARRVQAGLCARGLSPGQFALLQVEGTRDVLAAFWGSLFAGAIPVIVPVPASYAVATSDRDKLRHVFELLGRPLVVASSAPAAPLRDLVQTGVLTGAQVVELDGLRAASPAAAPHPAQPDDVAFLSLSSGSTGVPKCIQLTHRNILARGRGASALCGQSEHDVVLNWLPFDHIGSISDWHLRCVDLGCRMVYCDKERILGRPLSWLDLIERHRVTHSWAPNFAYALINAALLEVEGQRWDLSSMRSLLTAGEAVSSSTVDEFLTRLAQHGLARTAVRPAFGMAELGSGITYYQPSDAEPVRVCTVDRASLTAGLVEVPREHPRAISFTALGPVIAGMSMRIVDDARRILPEATIGHLHVAGLALSPGYLRNEEANRVFLDDGWFDTGDQGFVLDGQLYLTGRSKDCIIIHGANYFPAEIEKVAEEVRGVLVSFTAAYTVRPPDSPRECLALFFVPERDGELELERVVRAMTERLAQKVRVRPDYFVPLRAEEVPKTGIGKIQRKQLAARFDAGEFAATVRHVDLLLESERTLPDWFARPQFVPCASRATGPLTDVPRLVLGAGRGLARALRKLPPLASARLLDGDDLDEERLGRAIAAAGDGARLDIVDLRALDRTPGSWESAPAAAQGALSEWLTLLRVLERHPASRVRLFTFAENAQRVRATDRPSPLAAACVPALLAAARAYPWLETRHVDFEPGRELAEQLVQLAAELADGGRAGEVAYRSARRYVAGLGDVQFAPGRTPASPFVRGALYLVTGGLGGLGVELARHLLTRHGARVLLIGRSAVDPARADDPRARRLAQLAGLGPVRYAALDVADRGALERAVAEAEGAFGMELAGAFHLAGLAREGELAASAWSDVEALLAPKLLGAIALDRVLGARPSAFVVHASSLESHFPSATTAAYAVACRALEDFSAHEREAHGRASYALAFSAWDGVGMSAQGAPEALLRARGMHGIQPRQGLDALTAVLTLAPGTYAIGVRRGAPAIAPLCTGPSCPLDEVVAIASPRAPNHALPRELTLHDASGRPWRIPLHARTALPVTPGGDVDREAVRALLGAGGRVHVAPRDDAERTLATLFQQVLRVERVGVTEGFFDLGGSSLMALRLFGLIEARLGVKLPASTLYDAPTIEQLARLLSPGEAAEARRDSVFPLTASREGPALFLVHDADGETVLYGALARELAAHVPVYAIRPEGRDGVAMVQTRIEEMAAHYVARVRAIQPHGPYFLGGLCSGGVVAFEMGRQLEAAGERVGLVALLDSADVQAAPRSATQARGDRLAALLANRALSPGDKLRAAYGKLHNAARYEAARRAREARDRAAFLALRACVSRGLPLPAPLRAVSPRTIYHFAHREYQPGRVAGKLLLVRASERLIFDEPLDDTPARESHLDPELGWRARGDDFEVVDAPGGHSSMLRAPHVARVAEALRSRLVPGR